MWCRASPAMPMTVASGSAAMTSDRAMSASTRRWAGTGAATTASRCGSVPRCSRQGVGQALTAAAARQLLEDPAQHGVEVGEQGVVGVAGARGFEGSMT